MARYVASLSNLPLPSYMPGRFRDNELPKGGRPLHCILTPMAELRIYHQRYPQLLNLPSKDIAIGLLSS